MGGIKITGEKNDRERIFEQRGKILEELEEQMARGKEFLNPSLREIIGPGKAGMNETPVKRNDQEERFDLEGLEPPTHQVSQLDEAGPGTGPEEFGTITGFPDVELESAGTPGTQPAEKFNFTDEPDEMDTEIEMEMEALSSLVKETHNMKESKPGDTTNEIEEYQKDIEDFRARGYNISRLYGIFSKDIETIRKEILHYMEDVTKLKELEKELNIVDISGLDREVVYLRTLLKNPDAYSEARSYLDDLKKGVDRKESEERKSRLRDIEDLFEGILKEFSDVASGFQDEIADIKASIIDMETAPLSEFFNLKKKVWALKDSFNNERKKREEEEKKIILWADIKKWSKKGFDVSEIEAKVNINLKNATEMFNEFLPKAKMLLELEDVLNSLDTAGFEPEMKELLAIIHDPEKIIEVENKLESLQRRIRLSSIHQRVEKIKKAREAPPGERIGPTQMICPKCEGIVPIHSDERPLKVQCSSCNTEYNLKRIQTPTEIPQPPVPISGQPLVPISGQPPVPISGQPMVPPQAPQPSPVPIVEAEVFQEKSEAGTETVKCPKCGADLIPDSIFCGICGFRLTN